MVVEDRVLLHPYDVSFFSINIPAIIGKVARAIAGESYRATYCDCDHVGRDWVYIHCVCVVGEGGGGDKNECWESGKVKRKEKVFYGRWERGLAGRICPEYFVWKIK